MYAKYDVFSSFFFLLYWVNSGVYRERLRNVSEKEVVREKVCDDTIRKNSKVNTRETVGAGHRERDIKVKET